MVLLQKSWVEILSAVAERIEREHQDDQEKKIAKVGRDIFSQMTLRFSRHTSLQPGRRFIDFSANVNHQECGQRSDHEHAAPSNEREQSSIYQSGHQIANDVAFLQQAGEKSASFRG